ncbi:5-formyltetrahydrofolate cyclo-ligase [Maribacter sp. 4U21]|uniref:5-formyltetrahydrofolate cyclo-ligase n=1 Tax=Maribacter sp. 4U21 TaxID=1889779 RepID=UPI000C147970|nr:5-formyltetrahydrofolate cyclo-ligase [Maribacter sp. 4U21]PIB27237.1 5-formyltetrahydrofolate cyclo-ligase [Maribacter sp. 4U21]
MLKKDLSIKYSELRKSLTPAQLASQSLRISNNALQLPIWSFDYYHIFLPIQEKMEIDTVNIISILQGKDKNIVVPKIRAKTYLEHYLLTDSTLFVTNSWGVPEPVDGILIDPKKIDVVFLPLLAFDEMGNRLGYGKGFYDQFLKECRPDVLKIGLSVFEAEISIDDVNNDDVPLNFCITPEKNYTFKAS